MVQATTEGRALKTRIIMYYSDLFFISSKDVITRLTCYSLKNILAVLLLY